MTSIDIFPRGREISVGGRRTVAEGWLLALFLTVQGFAWTIFPAAIWTAPHSSTVELALWARDWFIVNYKHPALPSWLLAGAYDAFGNHLWVPFLVAQICIAATYLFVYLLGCALLGRRAALLGTLLLPAVSVLTVGTLKYNHNIAQLPLWAAFVYGLWRASVSDRLSWWIFTAIAAALGLYAKYTMGLVIAFGALWAMVDAHARARFGSRTIYIGSLVFVLLLMPLAVALGATDFGSVEWVSEESASRGISGLHFLRDVAETVAVMGAGMIAGAALSRLLRSDGPDSTPVLERRGLVFLIVMGGGPLLLTLVLALLKPSRLEWTAPMYSFLGLLWVAAAVRLRPAEARFMRAGLPHTLLALAASLSILATHATAGIDDYASGRINKDLWPTAEIGLRFDRLWTAQTGQPLHIVAGDSWLAGIVGLMSTGHPSLFTNFDLARSPAISEARLKSEGALVVWAEGASWAPDALMIARFPHGTESFAVGPKQAVVSVNYLLIAPDQWTDADTDRWLEAAD
jgi:4-amino-4-deoxy-L-arabinose transferase-like glycosyltransferase